MKVIEGQFGKRAPNDLSKVLRGIADDVDAGKVTSLVAAYIVDGEYEFTFSASLQDELVLATLLKDSVINHRGFNEQHTQSNSRNARRPRSTSAA